MKLLTILVLLSSSVFAGRIVPNIEWNQLNGNQTGAAAAQSNRNNIGIAYVTSDYQNNDSDYSSDIQRTIAQGFISNDKFSLETQIMDYRSNRSSDVEEYKAKYINTIIGKKVVKDLFAGAAIRYSDNKTVPDNTQFSMSVANQISKHFLLGGGFDYVTFNDTELAAKVYNLGLGFVKDNMALEGFVRVRPSESVDGRNVSSRNIITIQGAMNFENIQLAPYLYTRCQVEDFELTDEEICSFVIGSLMEYKFSERFFFGGGLFYSDYSFTDNNDSNNNFDSESLEFSISARYKLDNIQVAARFTTSDTDIYVDTGSDSSATEDIARFSVAYFF